MSKLYLAQVCAGIVLLASSASAAIHPPSAAARSPQHAQQVADRALPKAVPADARLFSNAMLDPARCNYEYVELYGTMVVRTELRLTCTTHR
jgi:hypothetical protein